MRDDNSKPYHLERTVDRFLHVLKLPPQRILVPLVVSAWALLVMSWSTTLLIMIVFGIILQYFIEYAMHRFLYHASPPDEVDDTFRWLYESHWGHHDFPNNPNLWGGTSVWFVPTIALCFFVVFWGGFAIFGVQPSFTSAYVLVFGGALPTYITYEWAHVTAHASGRKNALERYVTQMHAHHHFHNFETNFHVNAGGILVDKTFGTAYSKDRHVRIGNIRTMGLDPDDPRLVQLREEFADKFNITEKDRKTALL